VLGDRVQAQQLLLNLIANACDAMSKNVPEDRVLRIATEPSDDSVRISVTDRGTGIADAAMTSIFDPFVTSKQGGLGLGLTICQSIMRGHGGRLWVTNNPDRGATFWLEFDPDGPSNGAVASELIPGALRRTLESYPNGDATPSRPGSLDAPTEV